MNDSSNEDSPLFITSLARGLTLFAAFGPARPTMNLIEMAAATGLGKSAVQRLAFTLETLGYIAKETQSKRYRLTTKSLEIGGAYLQTSQLIELANPYLHELNRTTKETCNLLEPYKTDMVYVSRFASHQQISIHVPLGQRLPMYCTSSGRAYLAALPQKETIGLINHSRLLSLTQHTETDPERLLKIVAKASTDGFAFCNEECYLGDIAVGAAIVNAEGYPLGAINISVPFNRWTLKDVQTALAPQVVNTARSISNAARGLKSLPCAATDKK